MSAAGDLPLTPSSRHMREMLDQTGRRVIEFLETLPDRPSWATEEAARVREQVDEPPPETGISLDDILELLFERVVPCALETAGPGYLAYVPGGGLYCAALADFIAATVNRYVGVWAAAPGAVELETRVLRWLVELMGMPAEALGVFTTGGSLSNLVAVVAAREKHLGPRLLEGAAYLSCQTHHSVLKALRVAGIPAENIRQVPVDGRFRVRLDALQECIATDRRQGLVPFLLCGNAGTVNTGAVDPLDALADLAGRESMWFHVDGAYGGVFRLVPECRRTLAGIERADSLALDPHKGLFLAYGLGVLLVRDLMALRKAYGATASYLPTFQDGERHVDFCEISPELSRAWRGLRLWLPLKLHGVGAFRRALDEKRQLALHFHDELCGEDDVEIAAPPELSLFAFRQRRRNGGIEEENRSNRDLLERINAPRRVYLTGTEIDGVFWIRICVLHLRTDRARVDEGLGIIRDALGAIRGG